jgi:hypothetical protein
MNPTLQKCIEELKKDAPSLDYVRGILETLMDMQVPLPVIPSTHAIRTLPIRTDEETDYTRAYAGGPVANLGS